METSESKAAFKLQIAEKAMREAADALRAVDSDEARLHAAEMTGASNVARRWELELRQIHAARTAAQEG